MESANEMGTLRGLLARGNQPGPSSGILIKFSWASHSASASATLFANRSTSSVVVIIYFFSDKLSSFELYGASGKFRRIDSSEKLIQS
jgi:hypothetical protein